VPPAGERARLLDQRFTLDTAELLLARHRHQDRGKRIRAVLAVLDSAAEHVADPFDEVELRRMRAHLRSIESVNVRQGRCLRLLDDAAHYGKATLRSELLELQKLWEDERKDHASLKNAVSSVLVSRPVSDYPPDVQLRSRMSVLLAARLLQKAVGLKEDGFHTPDPRVEHSTPAGLEKSLSAIAKAADKATQGF
jgi:hypothetical protein